jgi:hypothetical protein
MTKYIVQCALGLLCSLVGVSASKSSKTFDLAAMLTGIGIGISMVTCYQLLTDPIDTPE